MQRSRVTSWRTWANFSMAAATVAKAKREIEIFGIKFFATSHSKRSVTKTLRDKSSASIVWASMIKPAFSSLKMHFITDQFTLGRASRRCRLSLIRPRTGSLSRDQTVKTAKAGNTLQVSRPILVLSRATSLSADLERSFTCQAWRSLTRSALSPIQSVSVPIPSS